MVPVEVFAAPTFALATQFPVMFSVPVLVFCAPDAAPPMQFPVMFSVPVPRLAAPLDKPPAPPVTFPVMLNVPEVENSTHDPVMEPPVPPVQFPTREAEFPAVPLNPTQRAVVDPAKAFAVSVTLFDKVKPPPAVALLALSLRTSPTVVLTFTVMAKLFECRTSAVVNVLQTSDAVPVGVVAQTSVASMFPAFLAK
jgi:hypothetical protein